MNGLEALGALGLPTVVQPSSALSSLLENVVRDTDEIEVSRDVLDAYVGRERKASETRDTTLRKYHP
jgi:hypothetical protein